MEYLHADLTGKIIGIFYDVYNELGHGFLEEVYAKSMHVALNQTGTRAELRVAIPVWFRKSLVGDFYADLLVENKVILTVRAGKEIEPFHQARLLNFLRASDVEVGLLLNFGLRADFKRLVFSNERKGRGQPGKRGEASAASVRA